MLLLLAAPALAQDADKPPPPAPPEEEPDSILDWLGGSAEPAPPTPPDPLPPVPRGEDESPLDWLAGDTPAGEGGTPAPGVAEEPGPKAVFDEPSPSSVAFAEKLREAMALELQVQEYEDSMLAGEAAQGELKGFKKQLWDRLQHDKTGFRQLAGQMSLQALDVPQPAPEVELPREAIALLAALDREYEASRAVRTIDQYVDLNQRFLKSADGAQRARAVAMRDDLVASEIAWTSLVQQSITLARGLGDPDLVTRMRESLDQLAPEAESVGDDLAVLVLKDPELRHAVMSEVTAMLTSVQEPPPPPRTDEELRPVVEQLQLQLAEKASLPPLIEEYNELSAELAKVEPQLELDLPLERRKDLVARRTDLLTRRNQVESAWYGSQPDPETWAQLVDAQDELIRRRMLDLGPAGVLYGERVVALREARDGDLPDTRSQWEYVEEQQAMITLLDGLEPEENLLRSASQPDLWGIALMKEAKKRAEEEKEILAKSAPKPVAKKKPSFGKQGGKPQAGKGQAGKGHGFLPPKKGKGKKPY